MIEGPAHAPLALDYDDLPAGSDVRREYDGAGGVRVTVPAGEPPAGALRAASQRAMIDAAVVCSAGLVLGILVVTLVIDLRRLGSVERIWAVAAFAALTGGVFLLLWRTRREARAEALRGARRQGTVFDARAGRLLIETAGPYGDESHDLRATSVRSITVRPGVRSLGGRTDGPALPCLAIDRSDGMAVQLLHGSDPVELRVVARTLVRALDLTQTGPPQVIS